ncbi:MAG: RloB domain-containing protein [Thermoguttaceae bacterium]|nr:RloB domain-containing protein [Thermoguttaceae bacterium]MBR5757889.1 RloB domain-containing protein [Thermoguttaceae bacterium]
MAPIEEYNKWTEQPFDSRKRIRPLKKFVFIAEGANTESRYFKEFIRIRNELGFADIIEVSFLDKTGEDLNVSAPIRLIEYAESYASNKTNRFIRKRDRVIIVFDADRFVRKPREFKNILEKAEGRGFEVGVTNPSFELFLLLHVKNAFEDFIKPHTKDLLAYKKTEKRAYSSVLFSKVFRYDSKSSKRVEELPRDVWTAIEQEKQINRDPNNCLNQLTSNIGAIMEMIYKEGETISKSRRGR